VWASKLHPVRVSFASNGRPAASRPCFVAALTAAGDCRRAARNTATALNNNTDNDDDNNSSSSNNNNNNKRARELRLD
jgi:hypothetical protein